MRICLLHNAVAAAAGPDEEDVLMQASSVRAALQAGGHEVTTIPCDLDIGRLELELDALGSEAAFNLVESLGAHARLISVVPYLLESRRIPHTGCPADALHLTSQKLLTKKLLRLSGLPTPVWFEGRRPPADCDGVRRWIIKPLWEDASVGIDDSSILSGDAAAAAERLLQRQRELGTECFAEAFIDGREFNLSLIEVDSEPVVLPPAEIEFVDYPSDKARLVGYAAKWSAGSFEYRNTQRRFPPPAEEPALTRVLSGLARDCWRLFALRGYARVDFRVDDQGRAWILEINSNPCLSPEAGFCAAAAAAGLSFGDAIDLILRAAA